MSSRAFRKLHLSSVEAKEQVKPEEEEEDRSDTNEEEVKPTSRNAFDLVILRFWTKS